MKIQKSVYRVMLVAVCALLVACAPKLNNDNLLKVKNGMTEAQVKDILGSPTKIDTGEVLGLRGSTYIYEKGKTNVQIHFINDSVVAKNGTFE